MFQDIVLALTPSEACECAVDTAIAFAQRFESKLTILHVYEQEHGGWGEADYFMNSADMKKLGGAIEEHYCEKLKGLDNCKVLVVPGVPHIEIRRVARSQDADLIIMGSPAKESLEHRSLSNLELVSQKARCPVMIVTQPTPYGEQKFLNILVATDFSPEAACAVSYGGQLAQLYKANLTLFHALDIEPGQMTQKEIVKLIDQSKERLATEYAERLRGIKNMRYECCEGRPPMEILKLARGLDSNLIMMAHHSRSRDPETALFGSTLAQVASNSNCPTLSINRHFDMRCSMM